MDTTQHGNTSSTIHAAAQPIEPEADPWTDPPTEAAGGSGQDPVQSRTTSPEPRTVTLRAAGPVRIASDNHASVTLLATSHAALRDDTTTTIRIVDAMQRRELRNVGTLRDGVVGTEVSGAWLTPGDYQVEVTSAGVLIVYRLTVTR